MKIIPARIIGIGQPNAGDDGVGLAVVRALHTRSLPPGVEIDEVTDPSRLIDLLEDTEHAILVDALVNDGNPGDIVCLGVEDLANRASMPLSSHGTSVAEAIALQRALAPGIPECTIRIVGINIAPPQPYTRSLSAAVAAALPDAQELVIELLTTQLSANFEPGGK